MVIILCRSTLYRQFDRKVIVAIGIYGIIAYATRPTTPLVTSLINDAWSWRWIFWVNVPLASWRFLWCDGSSGRIRPPKPHPPADRLDCRHPVYGLGRLPPLHFGWYRKWGGWTSQCSAPRCWPIFLPVSSGASLGGGKSMGEHLRRMFRVRIYVVAMWCACCS